MWQVGPEGRNGENRPLARELPVDRNPESQNHSLKWQGASMVRAQMRLPPCDRVRGAGESEGTSPAGRCNRAPSRSRIDCRKRGAGSRSP